MQRLGQARLTISQNRRKQRVADLLPDGIDCVALPRLDQVIRPHRADQVMLLSAGRPAAEQRPPTDETAAFLRGSYCRDQHTVAVQDYGNCPPGKARDSSDGVMPQGRTVSAFPPKSRHRLLSWTDIKAAKV